MYEKVILFVQLSSALLVLFVLSVTVPEYNFFSIHPICMSISYGFLFFQGVSLFLPQNLAWKRTKKITLHWSIQATALICASAGATVAVYNKILLDKPHFVSWHSWFGLATNMLTAGLALGGILAKNPSLLKGQPPVMVKLYHASGACLAFTLIAATLITGLQSNYFTRLTKDIMPLWQLVLLVPLMMVLSVWVQVYKSFAPRLKKK